MTEKILVKLPNGMHRPHLELTLCYTNELIRQGNQVSILYCSKKPEANFNNPLKLPITHWHCSKTIEDGLKLLDDSFDVFQVEQYHTPKFYYTNTQELKAVTYDGTKIGYSALSTYASLTRSANIDFNNIKTRQVIDNYLETAVDVANTTNQLLMKHTFDRFVLFNARLNTCRSFFDTAINKTIPVDVLELNYLRQNAMIFKNVMPHNISYNAKLIRALYDSMCPNKAGKIADDFFQKRSNSQFSNESSYTQNQEANELPQGWRDDVENYVVFNSSEDEFMAIGDEWEQDKLFENQYEGLRFLSDFAKAKNKSIYLRVHPNLNGTQKSYLDMVYALANNFFKVIPPDSEVSTYALLFKCTKVITFGSSIGIEATYWDKPSILLSNCMYRHLNITHNPTNKKELLELLSGEVNPIKNKIGCIQMVNHMLNPGTVIPGYSYADGKAYVNGVRIRKGRSFLQKFERKLQKRERRWTERYLSELCC